MLSAKPVSVSVAPRGMGPVDRFDSLFAAATRGEKSPFQRPELGADKQLSEAMAWLGNRVSELFNRSNGGVSKSDQITALEGAKEAATLLLELKQHGAFNILIDTAFRDSRSPDAARRIHACERLGGIDRTDVRARLLQLSADSDPGVRDAADKALTRTMQAALLNQNLFSSLKDREISLPSKLKLEPEFISKKLLNDLSPSRLAELSELIVKESKEIKPLIAQFDTYSEFLKYLKIEK